MDPRDEQQRRATGPTGGRSRGPLGPPGRRAGRRNPDADAAPAAGHPPATKALEPPPDRSHSGKARGNQAHAVGQNHAGQNRADQNRADQTRADQTGPDHTGPDERRARDGGGDPTVLVGTTAFERVTALGATATVVGMRALRDGSARTARFASRGARAVVRGVRRVTHAQGMGESGLSKLIELNAFHAGGDAAMAVGLAGTLFFAVPSAEARGRVALYLLITMAPFVVVAPLIGPFLDRFRGGRRWAIGTTMAVRAFFCWVVAGAVATGELWLYPLVFGCLIASKAHNITRAAVVPRLLPRDVALVTANSRISLSGSITAGVVAAAAGGLSYFGSAWALRLAFVIFTLGTLMAIVLPRRVDSAEGEDRLRMVDIRRTLRRLPAVVGLALRANVAFRAFTGFLMLFMAFLLRDVPLAGYSTTVQVGVIVGAAGAGNLVGTALGALARARRSEIVIQVLLAMSALTTIFAAIFYQLVLVAVLAFVAGFTQQLGKLCLDALIQSEVPEHVRTSVFARSETLLQLAWVVGGGIGIVLPLIPQLGLGICAAGLVIGLIVVLRTESRPVRQATPQPAEPPVR